jgi:hypothetical protein
LRKTGQLNEKAPALNIVFRRSGFSGPLQGQQSTALFEIYSDGCGLVFD